MKKIIFIIILVLYLLISIVFHPVIPCVFHEVTGLYCPGCGISRMLISILKFDFYQAFRYNPLLFIMLPFALALIVDHIYSTINKKQSLYKKINNKVWIILCVVLIIYGIVRNIYVPLSPTIINT